MTAPDVSLAETQGRPESVTLVWGSIAIEAAGGVLWRYGVDGSVEVALVHRPKYDDWSVPKGKIKRREHLLLGAVREVEEETGARVTVGRPLGEIRYLKEGLPKRVRYWSMFAVDTLFLEGDEADEVDQMHWLSPGDALGRLSYDRDVPAIERFMADLRPTWPLIVARHGSAGDRASWDGDDTLRPLDEVGEEQAAVLGSVLTAYAVTSVHSADVARCIDTVSAYAASIGATVVEEPAMSELGWDQDDPQGLDRLVALAQSGVPTVVSSQRGCIPGLLAGLLGTLGGAVPPDLSTRKGGFWVLNLTASAEPGALPELVSVERFEPVPQRT
ncbi:NUDIX hydrolase [Acidothermaceae bacterium B102]|nr:NUDIX hydrolase [Acidothermaceae bacterium B102]